MLGDSPSIAPTRRANPIKVADLETEGESPVQFFREGQVGRQYDGFLELDRFVSVPKSGYLVIYADMSNAYRHRAYRLGDGC